MFKTRIVIAIFSIFITTNYIKASAIKHFCTLLGQNNLKLIHQTAAQNIKSILESKIIMTGNKTKLQSYDYNSQGLDYLPYTFLEIVTENALEDIYDHSKRPILEISPELLETCSVSHFTLMWYFGNYNYRQSINLKKNRPLSKESMLRISKDIEHIIKIQANPNFFHKLDSSTWRNEIVIDGDLHLGEKGIIKIHQ